MKVLLDECLPLDFRHHFPDYEVHTAQWAGLKGKKNGEMLQAAEAAGYEVFLTVDQGIPRQPRPASWRLAVILVRSRTNQIEDLLPLVDAISKILEGVQHGETVTVRASE